MKLRELRQLSHYKSQYSELREIYFLKCKELYNLEEHLNVSTAQIQALVKDSRAKLKNTKTTYKPKI